MIEKPKGKPTDPRAYLFVTFIVLVHIAGFVQALWMINSEGTLGMGGVILLMMLMLSIGTAIDAAKRYLGAQDDSTEGKS